MSGTLYAFATDLVDEGIDAVVAATRAAGLDTLALAMAYHRARDVVPHAGAKPRVRFRRDGVFFHADWTGSFHQPALQSDEELAAVGDLLADRRGIRLEGWTVFLHNSSAGAARPDLVSTTCFGDPLLANLCPSQPEVVDYAVRLATHVAALGIDVIAEALSAQTFGHGHHHERTFFALGAGDAAMLGVCFCAACSERARRRGGHPEALRASVSARVQRSMDGAPPLPAELEALLEEFGPDLSAQIEGRRDAVVELTAAVASAVHGAGQRLCFMDLTGAALGYDDGAPRGPAAAAQSWLMGVRPADIAPLVDSYTVLGYAADPTRLAADVGSYRAAVEDAALRVVLRPGHPDTDSAEHLAAKVDAARSAGADRIDYYNYGMYPEHVLERIPAHSSPPR